MTTYTAKEYAQVLADAGRQLHPQAVRTLNRAAGNIKRDWRARAAAKNPVHAPKYAGAIVMRRTIVEDGNITATVEPRFTRHGQGSLAPVLEWGGPYSAAQYSNVQALAGELPTLLRWLRKFAAEAAR